MSDLLVSTFLTAGVSAVAAVVAWVTANFFADPLLEFQRRRRAIHESLFFTANIGESSSKEDIDSAISELRRHAAALDALWSTSPSPVQKWLLWRGYNVKAAAENLTGFSNSIFLQEGSRAIHRHRIEKGLCFRLSYSDEDIREILRAKHERVPA